MGTNLTDVFTGIISIKSAPFFNQLTLSDLVLIVSYTARFTDSGPRLVLVGSRGTEGTPLFSRPHVELSRKTGKTLSVPTVSSGRAFLKNKITK